MTATVRLTKDIVPATRPTNVQPRRLRLGLLTPHNPYDRQAFSGTAHHAARALAQMPGLDLTILGPHRPRRRLDRLLRRRSAPVDPGTLNLSGLDAILGLVATPLLNAVADQTNLPLIHVTDATPSFLRDVYGYDIPAAADGAEVKAVANASAVVYSSNWMAKRARQDLGMVAHKAQSLPFGINLESPPEFCPEKPSLDRLELLFVGANWDRKGGDFAVATLEALRARGHEARLRVVGRIPDRIQAHPHVTVEGFLDKNRRREAARLEKLYAQSHAFVLPSKADCTPMVLAEAMAHGTPVLASDVGAIAEIVGQGAAGRVLPVSTGPTGWAEAIADMTADSTGYTMVSDAAFDRATARLNWTGWAEGIAEIAYDVVANSPVVRAA